MTLRQGQAGWLSALLAIVGVMRFGVLGALTVHAAGEPVTITRTKVRALLADLLAHDGRPVSADRLVDDLWGTDPPRDPVAVLQVRVAQLRRALEDAEPGGRGLVVSTPAGYLLRAESTDAAEFATLVRRTDTAADLRTKVALLDQALALWRGPAYADFADEPFAGPTVTRLTEQRRTAIEDRAQARLDLGEYDLGELAELVEKHPLREPRASRPAPIDPATGSLADSRTGLQPAGRDDRADRPPGRRHGRRHAARHHPPGDADRHRRRRQDATGPSGRARPSGRHVAGGAGRAVQRGRRGRGGTRRAGHPGGRRRARGGGRPPGESVAGQATRARAGQLRTRGGRRRGTRLPAAAGRAGGARARHQPGAARPARRDPLPGAAAGRARTRRGHGGRGGGRGRAVVRRAGHGPRSGVRADRRERGRRRRVVPASTIPNRPTDRACPG